MEPKKPDDIFARRRQIEASLDPNRYTALRRLATDPGNRFVVCFGGGSAIGLGANVALVHILEELDLKGQVSQIWGTSAGAIVGGSWASGTSPEKMLPLVSRGIAALIDKGLRVKTFEDCAIEFRCIAVSEDGQPRRTVLRQGALLPAIYASMTLPGIFISHGPLPGQDRCYFDGGVVEKTPLLSPISEHLRSGDPRKLVLLATHFGSHGHLLAGRSFIHRFFQTVDSLEELAWPYQLLEARNYPNVALALLDPQINVSNVLDFSLVESHYFQAKEKFTDALQNARLALLLGSK